MAYVIKQSHNKAALRRLSNQVGHHVNELLESFTKVSSTCFLINSFLSKIIKRKIYGVCLCLFCFIFCALENFPR